MSDPKADPKPVDLKKEFLAWFGGALLVLAGLGVYLWWTAPEGDLLAAIYAVL